MEKELVCTSVDRNVTICRDRPVCIEVAPGLSRCEDPNVCVPPASWSCTPYGAITCTCAVPPPPARLCTASITYPVNMPDEARLQPLEHGCPVTGAAIALAVIAAELVGKLLPAH